MPSRRPGSGAAIAGRKSTGAGCAPLAGAPALRRIALRAAAFAWLPASLAAQAPGSPEGDGVSRDAPPVPVAPEVVSRDQAGQVTVRAVRLADPLVIDGALEEPLYRDTPSVSDFVQSLPTEGATPTERTEAWVGFDDANVYVAARVWDSAPEEAWVANEMRRDAPSIQLNDQFGVFLDTYYDRRNGVGFIVNPLGGFIDLQIMNEEDANTDWNPVTEIRTGRFEGGWSVEMAIPFRSLRYQAGRDQVWGIQMRRSIVRRNEWNHLTLVSYAAVGNGTRGTMRVSSYGTLVGIQPPPPGRNLEIKPYAISGLRTDRSPGPELANEAHADLGLDVKYGITENLTADLTLNTDFAQVEVDEQQANLTRFNVFFPEKREFFLESQGIFEFGNGGRGEGSPGGGGPPGSSSVSSSGRGRGARSVHAPTLFYSRRIGLHDGAPVPIVGGGRVTGKVGSFDVGAVGIRTGAEGSVGADPATFTVVRLRRDLLARSNVGVLFEDRSTSVTAAAGGNRAYGADANFAFLENLQIFGYYARTETEGLGGRDDSYRSRVAWRGNIWSASVDHTMVGEDFNPEMGFLRRRGFRETNLFGRWSPRLESVPSIRRLSLAGRVMYLENERVGFVESRQQATRLEVEFENGDWLTVILTDVFERLSGLTRISGAVIPAGSYPFRDAEVSYYLGPRRRVSGSVSVTRGSFYSGSVTALGLARGRIEVLPQLSLEPSIEMNWIDLPGLQERSGQFDQHVLRTRATYSLGPRSFVSGLVQYNTESDTFGANVRLRWEWAPGSELFIVYTEDRDADVLDRWSELSARALVIKVNRLLRP